MRSGELAWRGVAGLTRRLGSLLVSISENAYARAEPAPTRVEQAILNRNEQFRDLHRGRRCFVVGNGPSVGKQDLRPLGGEITLTMSAFWRNNVVDHWQPTYYCFADGVYFDGTEQTKTFFGSLRARIHSTTFFFPLNGKEVFDRQELLPSESTYFVSFNGQALGLSIADTVDLTRRIPFVYSTAQLAVMMAIYMGCSPIYLMGLDHDWLSHRGMDRHFYSGPSIDNHALATGALDNPYDDEMQAQWKLWQGYRKLDKIARSRGLKIVNATRGGFLDVFERVDYEALVARGER